MLLPEGFMSRFEGLHVPALDALPQALDEEPSVAVRYNLLKHASPPDGFDAVPWCPEGCYLPSRPQFTLDPALHQGLYYVQDASSMFIAHVVRHLTASGDPVRYLDACAAPGGKTTAAISALPAGSLVVANEYVASRAAVLRENLLKWGAPAVVTQGDVSRFAADGATFHIIAADVPCSGEGMMRKDEKAVSQWSPGLVEQCVSRQRYILDTLWPALLPGGFLIYSTCTFNLDENEHMVRYLMDHYGAEPVTIPVQAQWGIIPAIGDSFPAFRFIPGAIRGEGLFMAVVRKPAGDELLHVPQRAEAKKKRRIPPASRSKVPDEVCRWFDPAVGITLSSAADGSVTANFPTHWPGFRYVPQITVATPRGRDLLPSHALAMSVALRPEAFTRVDVDIPVALDYLRCLSVALPSSAPRGVVLLTHRSRPLGFVKNIGSRANNLYPHEWRILK